MGLLLEDGLGGDESNEYEDICDESGLESMEYLEYMSRKGKRNCQSFTFEILTILIYLLKQKLNHLFLKNNSSFFFMNTNKIILQWPVIIDMECFFCFVKLFWAGFMNMGMVFLRTFGAPWNVMLLQHEWRMQGHVNI